VEIRIARTITDGRGYHPGMEIDRMMEYPWVARQRTCGADSVAADQLAEASPPREGPTAWPEWKQEDALAYQQYLDEFFKGY
jgi:hypothetical protein